MLHAAKRDRRTGNPGAVDRDHSVLQGPGQAINTVGVFGMHVGDEAIFGIVGAGQGFCFAVERRYRRDRTELARIMAVIRPIVVRILIMRSS